MFGDRRVSIRQLSGFLSEENEFTTNCHFLYLFYVYNGLIRGEKKMYMWMCECVASKKGYGLSLVGSVGLGWRAGGCVG